MYTLDAAMAAVLESGTPTVLVRLVSLDEAGAVTATYDLARQAITGGSARAELRRDVRRSATLEVTGAPLALAPLPEAVLTQGAALRVEIGALVAGGPVWVPVVAGYVTGVVSRMSPARVSLTVESYLSACRQDVGEAFTIAAGTPLPAALHALWDPVLPNAEWRVDDIAAERVIGTDVPVPQVDNRLDVGLRLARAVGCEAYDDRLGRIVVRERPDPTAQATVRAMVPNALERGSSRPPVNAQAVEASPGDGEPFYVVEHISDPASPQHRDRIGLRMAPVIRSDTIPDPDTARAAARSWLAGRMLRADEVSDTAGPRHIDLDEGDVVSWDEPLTRTSGRFQVEAIEYPLGPGAVGISATSVLPLFITDETTPPVMQTPSEDV